MNTVGGSSGARYVTSFKEQLFGGKCEIEVVVDLSTRAPSSVLAMIGFLSSRPTFAISLENLKLLTRAVADLKSNAKLLGALTEGETGHQLNCTVGGATAIVVQPPGKPGRFTLAIGTCHREGQLEELDTRDIDEAIKRIEALQNRVVQKVAATTNA